MKDWRVERQEKIDALEWNPITPRTLMDSQTGHCFIRTKKEKHIKYAILAVDAPAMPMAIVDSSVFGGPIVDYIPSFSRLEFFCRGLKIPQTIIESFAVIPDDWEFWEE